MKGQMRRWKERKRKTLCLREMRVSWEQKPRRRQAGGNVSEVIEEPTQNVEVEGAASQEETETRGRQTLSHLLGLTHPNDPAHVLQLNIKWDEAFILGLVN